MASPFRIFRKYQKTLLVVAGVVLMFVFVIGDALVGYLGGRPSTAIRQGNAVAARWDGGRLTNNELEHLVRRRQFTNTFLERVEGEGMRAAYLAGVEPRPLRVAPMRGPETPQQGVENSVVQTRIFADAARAAGMNVSDATVVQYLDELGRGNVSRDDMRAMLKQLGEGRVSIDFIIDALREEMLARNYHASHRFAFETVTPEQRWEDWLSVNDRIVLEAAAVPAESQLIDVKEPTDAELTAFFEKTDAAGRAYKAREPQPEVFGQVELPSPTPGFATPRKINVQYIEAPFEEFLAKAEPTITDEEIAKFYEENKEMFPKSAAASAETTEADSAAEEPATDAETEAASTEQSTDSTPATDENPVEGEDSTEPESNSAPSAESETAPPETTEAPASEETAPSAEEPSPSAESPADDDQSSLDGADRRGVFRQVAFLQDSESSDESKSEAAEAPANEAVETTDAAPTDLAPADTSSAAEEKPKEYQPLEDVRDLIRSELAHRRALENMNKVMDEVATELSAEFNNYFGKLLDAQAKKQEAPAPPPALADLTSIAEKHGLQTGKSGSLSALQMRDTPIGKTGRIESGIPLLQALFGSSDIELYQPISTADVDRNRYIVMKTSDTPGRVPELADVRDEVIRAWKLDQASQLALKRAEELAKKAQESKSTLADFFADDKLVSVVRTDPFSQLTGGDVAFVGGQFQQQPFRLSQPDGIVAAGPEFITKVFELKDGEVGAAQNHDHSIAYVVRIAEHQDTVDQLRQAFLAEANTWDGVRLKTQAHAMQAASQLVADLGPNFKWERRPDQIEQEQPAESEE